MACIALCRSSACARNWRGSGLRLRSTTDDLTAPQLLEPQRVTHRLHSHQSWLFQLPVEPLRFPVPHASASLPSPPPCGLKNRNLLVAGMKIASYNLHKAPLLPLRLRSSTHPKSMPVSIGAFLFIQSTGGEAEMESAFPYTRSNLNSERVLKCRFLHFATIEPSLRRNDGFVAVRKKPSAIP